MLDPHARIAEIDRASAALLQAESMLSPIVESASLVRAEATRVGMAVPTVLAGTATGADVGMIGALARASERASRFAAAVEEAAAVSARQRSMLAAERHRLVDEIDRRARAALA